jgi:predicted Zn-dependent peptidase
MTFEAVVPAEELTAALWVAADRLTILPALIDDAAVARNRKVVLEERAMTDVDVPYGLFHDHVLRKVFKAPHPLHAGVMGTPDELSRVTAADVRRFVAERLVAANGILTVVGRFEPGATLARIEELFGGLPAGVAARPPRLPPLDLGLIDKAQEPLGRCPRVAMAWRFPALAPEDDAALALGAQLLTLLTDGAWDMRLSAELARYDGENLFFLELSVPYDEPMSVVHADADGLLRQLTHKEMPVELVWNANLALDRVAVDQLDSVAGRAALLTGLEHQYGGRYRVADLLGWHWLLEASAIRDTARTLLSGPSVVVHARPTHPRPARVERE